MQQVKQEKQNFLKENRNTLIGALLVITLVNGILSNLFSQSFILDYFVQTLVYALFASVQIMIVFAYRDGTRADLKSLMAVFKRYRMNLLMLGLMVEMVSYFLSNIVFMVLSPFLRPMLHGPNFAIGMLLSFITLGIGHFITYLFLFAPYYIVDREMLPFDAFVKSFKDTKGHKLTMFNLELPYIMIVSVVMLVSLLTMLVLRSALLASAALLLSSLVTIYFSVDMYTLRALYYEKVKEETVL